MLRGLLFWINDTMRIWNYHIKNLTLILNVQEDCQQNFMIVLECYNGLFKLTGSYDIW